MHSSSLPTDRDYFSPGLTPVAPDLAFPHMRPGDRQSHPWEFLRREIPHVWYVDDRYPLMGFLNRDEATLLHNIALRFAGLPALEIGSWLGWSTCHLALGGVVLDVIDPAHDDPAIRAIVEHSLTASGVAGQVTLHGGHSPAAVADLAARTGRRWSLFFIDGDHNSPGPVRDTRACLPHAAEDCAFVFHDLASPDVSAALRFLEARGFQVMLYQTAQIMGIAWRGGIRPVTHRPDPDVAWHLPDHLAGLPVSGSGEILPAPPASGYRELRQVEYPAPAEPSLPTVCIVTNEIIGPFKNGGIGTSMTGLAEMLASAGHAVTILYTGAIWAPDVSPGKWERHYSSLGIEFVALRFEDMQSLEGPLRERGYGVPQLVYEYLKTRSFHVVHFNDCCGEGSLCLTARALGLAFENTLLAVALHSPSQWVLELNRTLPVSLLFAAYNYSERLSIRNAGVLWGPSRYLLDWSVANGFQLPEQTFVQQYALPTARISGSRESGEFPDVAGGRSARPREIVFFGRLEERKGLRLFCNAIHRLRDELARREISVTFLGKPETCGGLGSLEYIAGRSAHWRFPVTTLTNYGQPEALQYLRDGSRLAVMPSPFDNSPCTVYEALAWGIPFLASRTGGIPELIAIEDRGKVLFDYSAEALEASLLDALDHGGWIARAAVPQSEIRRSWLAMHANWWRFLTPLPQSAGPRTRSVVAIVDHQSGDDFDASLRSLLPSGTVRRVVVLNRAGEDVALSPLPTRNINLLVDDPGTLIEELRQAGSDAILLLRSGVKVKEGTLAPLLSALDASGVDALLPAGSKMNGGRTTIVPALGGSPAFSLFEGVTYAGGMLVRSDAILLAADGRLFAGETAFLGLADLAVAHGGDAWPYPEVVFELPDGGERAAVSAAPARVAAYAEASSVERYYMLAAGFGASSGGSKRVRRELALALVDQGLGSLVRTGMFGIRWARRTRALWTKMRHSIRHR